jgi:hypothetical protein
VLRGVLRSISLYVCILDSFIRILFRVFSMTVIVSQYILDWFDLILYLAVFVYANQSPPGLRFPRLGGSNYQRQKYSAGPRYLHPERKPHLGVCDPEGSIPQINGHSPL